MGITDFFRPKYRHSDVKVRLEAVRALSSDESDILATVARTDRDPGVRKVAIEKLDLADVLAEIARDEADRALKSLAGNRAAELWVSAASGDDEELASDALAGLINLGDARAIAQVAGKAELEAIRSRALDAIDDPRALAELAKTTSHPTLRAQALAHISDRDVLRAIAVDTTLKELGLAALERIDDAERLENIANKAKHKAVRQRARKKADDLAEEARAAKPKVSDEARRRRAEHAQLLRELESHVDTFEWEKSLVAVGHVETAWGQLGPADDATTEDRFKKAIRRYHARRQAAMEQNARALMDAEDRRREAERRAREDAEAAERRDRERAEREEEARAAKADGGDETKRAEREARRAEEAERRAADEADRAARRKEVEERGTQIAASLDALITDLESLIGTKDGRVIDRALEQAAKAFSQLGKVAPDKRDGLDKRYQDVRGRLVIAIKDAREAEDWQRWSNVPRAEALIKEAQALLEAEAPPTLDALKALQQRWKTVGTVPQNKNKELWDKFKTATDAVFERIKGVRAVETEKFAASAALKEQLIAQAEALSTSTDWVATAAALKELQRQWKESGPLPRRQGDELWKKFRSACDRFFEARKPHLEAEVADQQQNLDDKTRLCERAEAIVAAAPGDGGWGAAITAIRNLQRDWKEIGFVPRKDADAIYARFRAACDALFAKRDDARDSEANAQRAELDAVRAALAGEGDLAARVIAARAKVRELAPRGIAPDAELAAELDRATREAIASGGAGLAGTELDPAAMASKRDKLIARVEELAPKQQALEPGLSPEQLVAKLKSAIASRALGDFGAGRDPVEAIHELRTQWAEVGPVVGAAAEAAAARFEDACKRVLADAQPSTNERAERSERTERAERSGRRERVERERTRRATDRPPRADRTEPGFVPAPPPPAVVAAPAAAVITAPSYAESVPVPVPTATPNAETIRHVAPPAPVAASTDETIRNVVPPPPSPGLTPAPAVEEAPEPPPTNSPGASEMAGDGAVEGDVDSGWD